MIKMIHGKIKEITVSNPSRILGRMYIQISGIGELSIKLPTGKYAGQSIKIKL